MLCDENTCLCRVADPCVIDGSVPAEAEADATA